VQAPDKAEWAQSWQILDGLAVIRVAAQRLGVQHELPALDVVTNKQRPALGWLLFDLFANVYQTGHRSSSCIVLGITAISHHPRIAALIVAAGIPRAARTRRARAFFNVHMSEPDKQKLDRWVLKTLELGYSDPAAARVRVKKLTRLLGDNERNIKAYETWKRLAKRHRWMTVAPLHFYP
jgi:hypothetical protein